MFHNSSVLFAEVSPTNNPSAFQCLSTVKRHPVSTLFLAKGRGCSSSTSVKEMTPQGVGIHPSIHPFVVAPWGAPYRGAFWGDVLLGRVSGAFWKKTPGCFRGCPPEVEQQVYLKSLPKPKNRKGTSRIQPPWLSGANMLNFGGILVGDSVSLHIV